MAVFQQRFLLDYAVPVSDQELVKGQHYFDVSFIDENMMVPQIFPVVFLGFGLPTFEEDRFVFQDASSYFQGVAPDAASTSVPVRIDTFPIGGLGSIYTFDAALDVLLRCSLRREKLSNSGGPISRHDG